MTTGDKRPPVIAIMGPTASGKTGLAMAVVAAMNAEIVSVDSAMVYRGMDIGTAKPSAAELARAPHRLIDVCDPAESYSAGRFREDALAAVAAIDAAGRLPLLVGGTMLYFRALFEGLAAMPAADPAVRHRIDARAREEGWPALHAELKAVDPAAAERIHPNDAQRIQRALEVYQSSGVPISVSQKATHEAFPYRTLRIALIPEDRAWLHERIERRLATMRESGFLEEVRALHARTDIGRDASALRAVGYRQLLQYLDGESDLEQAWQDAATATRRLARRQLTWLRGEKGLLRLDPSYPALEAIALAEIRRWAGTAA